MDNLSPQIHGEDPENTSVLFRSIKDKVSFLRGDVRNKSDWEKALTGIEVVVHLAAETGTGQSMYEIEKYTETNIGGTAVMLDLLANNKNFEVQKVVIASSRSIYGEGKYFSEEFGIVYPEHRSNSDMLNGDFEVKFGQSRIPLQLLATDENSKIHPSSVYGITKQNQEQMIMCVCKALNIQSVSLRYQNVYGPGQSLKNPYTGILSIFSTLIKTGKSINIFEDGKESRDFVYIDDVVKATILAIEKSEANGEIFNVGSGVPIDVLTVAKTLIRVYQTDIPLAVSGNFRVGDIRHNFADLSKIAQILGYAPQTSFEEGIRLFTEWVNDQEIVNSGLDASLSEMQSKGLFK